jgi:methyl-accepting chemotaxis protein
MNNGLSYIRRWMWSLLLIVLLTAALAFILVYHEISSGLDHYQLAASNQTLGDGQAAQPPHSGIKLRVFLLLTAGYFSALILSVIWLRTVMRRIHHPLEKIQRAVSNLAQGKLNETVDISSTDAFGQIGSGINELAANLQELLLYIWKQTGQCMHIIDEIAPNGDCRASETATPCTNGHILQLKESVESLREMAKAYVFYDVRLEGDKTLAINSPGKKDLPGTAVPVDE